LPREGLREGVLVNWTACAGGDLEERTPDLARDFASCTVL
jgi:hypothetical protein